MKRILAVFIFLLLSFCIQAQIPGFNIGPKIGYNTRKFTTDLATIQSDPEGAFQFGAFMRIGKKIYVQPEASYIVKGGKISMDGGAPIKIKLNSITVPVLVGFRLINAGVFNARVMAGPAFSFITDKTVPMNEIPTSFPIKTEKDLKDSMWSFQMGGGVDVLNFTLDVRYEIGVDNIYTGADDFSIRNNLLNISLGLKLL